MEVNYSAFFNEGSSAVAKDDKPTFSSKVQNSCTVSQWLNFQTKAALVWVKYDFMRPDITPRLHSWVTQVGGEILLLVVSRGGSECRSLRIRRICRRYGTIFLLAFYVCLHVQFEQLKSIVKNFSYHNITRCYHCSCVMRAYF